jgi:hypothetical protein
MAFILLAKLDEGAAIVTYPEAKKDLSENELISIKQEEEKLRNQTNTVTHQHTGPSLQYRTNTLNFQYTDPSIQYPNNSVNYQQTGPSLQYPAMFIPNYYFDQNSFNPFFSHPSQNNTYSRTPTHLFMNQIPPYPNPNINPYHRFPHQEILNSDPYRDIPKGKPLFLFFNYFYSH